MMWRKTTQDLAPVKHPVTELGVYDIYPAFKLETGKMQCGFEALAEQIADQQCVILDGYIGVFWEDFRQKLSSALEDKGIKATWTNINSALFPPELIDVLVQPFLGGHDPIFGTRFTGVLEDFFDLTKLIALQPNPETPLNIIYGCGAALSGWTGMNMYLDVPKNEIQFRARAGKVLNLGTAEVTDAKTIYKRMYFVDWIVLNAHKAKLLPKLDLMVDAQRPDEPMLMHGIDFRAALETMTKNFFRVRPWFEPGPWGGQWIKKHIPALPQDAPNYAWSFELITPENGVLLESDGLLLEVSFDYLMFYNSVAVLGQAAKRFGFDFPIRFDWLDTIKGGNLSLQVHPSPEYAKQHFGESFTQDETYYMLECEPNAEVFLGFQDTIDPNQFRAALEQSYTQNTVLEVDTFVQRHKAKKHDLFLIPHGTIHCSGVGGLVLEISATPYIFTFKMYDWLRLDLDGQPRPMNIARAFENLNFTRRGDAVQKLISQPIMLESGEDWQIVSLPTHPDHFYEIDRLEFGQSIELQTENSCHVLCLVEGTAVLLETANGLQQRFNYAETFVIPAAAKSYRLTNQGATQAKVIRAYVRPLENSL